MSTEQGTQASTALVVAKKNFLQSPAMIQRLTAIASKHITVERLVRVALVAMQRQPRLLQCTNESLAQALITCSEIGLEPGIGGDCYIIPYKDVATFQIGYQGLKELVWRSNEILIDAHVVYDCDRFDYAYGTQPRLIHEPEGKAPRTPDAKRTHAYMTATFPDGRMKFEVLTATDVEKIRKASPAASKPDSPWVNWPDEMWRKSAAKRGCKWLPKSIEVQRAIEVDTSADLGADDFNLAADPNDISDQSQSSVDAPQKPQGATKTSAQAPKPTTTRQMPPAASKPANGSKQPNPTQESQDTIADSRKRIDIQKIAAKLSTAPGYGGDVGKVIADWTGGVDLRTIGGAELDSIYEAAISVLADAERESANAAAAPPGELQLETPETIADETTGGLADLIQARAAELSSGDPERQDQILDEWFTAIGLPQDATFENIGPDELRVLFEHAQKQSHTGDGKPRRRRR